MTNRITIVDNTLREGEQTPGVAFSVDDKLAIMNLLLDAGITFFDAAFPESAREEKEFVARARLEIPNASIGATCRLIRRSMEAAIDVGAMELFVIVPTSDVHLEKRLQISRSQMLEMMSRELAGIAADASVNIALEDAFRADEDFLFEVLDASRSVGATRVFLADTVGVVLPWKVRELVGRIRSHLPPELAIGTHFHNDFGLALANSLAAIEAGATHPTASMNGLGERAGNTDLTQLSAATRFLLNRSCPVKLDRLRTVGEFLMKKTGILVSQTAPFTGFNAFRHTSGIHVHGFLSDRKTYEAIDPSDLGARSQLVLGKHSGRSHIRHLLADRVGLTEEQVGKILRKVKESSLLPEHSARRAELYEAYTRFNNEDLGVNEDEILTLLDAEDW